MTAAHKINPLLFEAELRSIRVGDLIRWPREPDRWYRVIELYEPYRSVTGVLRVPYRAEEVGAPTIIVSDSLSGPSSSGPAYYGTRKNDVQFQARDAA